jgi:drug/metabolite transporter (DMT)-like permease
MLQGLVASGVAFAVQTWCIDRGGPVFVAVYQPVQTLLVAVMASLLLGEQFYLGGYVINVSVRSISFFFSFHYIPLPPSVG